MTTTQKIVRRIAESWSREKDAAQPMGLEHEIQYQLGCSWGAAISHANTIRVRWPLNANV